MIIPIEQNNPRVVITDGYHITKPLKLVYKDIPVYCFKVDCAITNTQLLTGLFLLVPLFIAGFITGFLLFKVLSFIPIVYLVLFYYLNRKDFIKLVPVVN